MNNNNNNLFATPLNFTCKEILQRFLDSKYNAMSSPGVLGSRMPSIQSGRLMFLC